MKTEDWNHNTQRTVEHNHAGYEESIVTQIMTYLFQFASQLFLVILWKTVSSSIQIIMKNKFSCTISEKSILLLISVRVNVVLVFSWHGKYNGKYVHYILLKGIYCEIWKCISTSRCSCVQYKSWNMISACKTTHFG